MVTSIGRLRPCPVLGYKFAALSHNTIRGAAGCSILNAELLAVKRLYKGNTGRRISEGEMNLLLT